MLSIEFVFFIFLLPVPVLVTCPESSHLQWAPGMRKYVYMTFLNEFNCPSWVTRNPFTKDPTNRAHRKIPIGSPFAFLCGACFTSYTSLSVNLSLVSGELEVDFQQLSKSPGKALHRGKGGDDCLVSMGVTEPITKAGSLTCRLNRGSKSFDEKVTFSTIYVPIIEDEMETIETTDSRVELSCPQIEDITPDVVYVWHTPSNEDPHEPKIMVPSMRQNVTLQLRSPTLKVTCSTYDSYSPNQVRRKSFLIKGKRIFKNTGVSNELVAGPANTNADEPKTSMSFATIAIIVGAIIGGIVLVAILVSVTSVLKRSCADSHNPQSTQVPLMTGKLSVEQPPHR